MEGDAQMALSVKCGSCKNVINVPLALLERLLEVQRFNCPHCKAAQHIPRQFLADAARRMRGAPPSRLTNRIISEVQRHRIDDNSDGDESEDEHEAGEVFADYKPSKVTIGRTHPDPVVETASLAAVEPPDITYVLHLDDVIDAEKLSGLQLEAILYACQRHEQTLPGGARCGFFIGDGAGVGKGRTIAGLILENWRCGRKRHLWVSIGSDLKVDARRDLDDVGAGNVDIYALNKLQYGRLDSEKLGVKEGVVFLSYSSLISGCDKGQTRIDQITEWCGANFEGLIVFDECHKAKNLIPEAGAKPTKVGRLVLELQQRLPGSRVVYCSATGYRFDVNIGACEPRNMGYMERLGLWGAESSFENFADFLDVVGTKGVGALEMIAMDMKARGMYVCRTLSFAGAEFEIVETDLEEPLQSQYPRAAEMWSKLRREFLYALEQQAEGQEEGASKKGNILWRAFWGAHQRFFRHMCMAAKVPALVRTAEQALADGKCVVIGLQSTGEARTQDVVAERGEELDDFVSGPRELLLKLVEDHYPMPINPDQINGNNKTQGDAKACGKRSRGSKANGETANGRAKKRSCRQKVEQNGDFSNEAETLNGCSNNLDPVGSATDEDEYWERRNGSGPPSTSQTQAEIWAQTPEGRGRLMEARENLQSAASRKAQVKACMASLELPHNPLDMLIDLLGGPEKVAEMTGRKGRLVRIKRDADEEEEDEKEDNLLDGTLEDCRKKKCGVRWEARNARGVGPGATLDMINVHERQRFLDGVKLIAIISEAASAGISLHADKRAQNQKRRVHLTLELPWSADKAIQQFGRSHRANQAHGPQYRLLFTALGGERRFASSVARRLESLGALTQGDRKGLGLSLHNFNYESVWGQRALKQFYRIITGNGHLQRMSVEVFLGQARAQLLAVGIIRPNDDAIHINQYMQQTSGAPVGVGKIADTDKQDVSRFLNRLLGLAPTWQCYLFDFFQALLDHTIARAKQEGKFQDGIVDLRATSVSMSQAPKVIWTDETTKASSMLCSIVTDRGVSWQQAQEVYRPSPPPVDLDGTIDLEPLEPIVTPGLKNSKRGFYRSLQRMPGTSKYAVLLGTPQDESTNPNMLLIRPNTGRQTRPMPWDQFNARYAKVEEIVAKQLWEESHSESNLFHGYGNRLKKLHIVSGLVLPIWPQIESVLAAQARHADRRLNVIRLETTDTEKKRFVGVLLPQQCVEPLLDQLRAVKAALPQNGPIDLGD